MDRDSTRKFGYSFRWLGIVLLLAVMSCGVVAGASWADVIVDNGQPGTAATGEWAVSGGTLPYGADSLWARDGATYSWQMSDQPAGIYNVYIHWSGWPSRSAQVATTVDYSGGQAELVVDQSVAAGQWNLLGSYYFNGAGKVTIVASNGSTTSTCADAVWFEFVSAESPPQAVIESILPNPAAAGEEIVFQGSGSDAQGAVVDFIWESDVDGVLSHQALFSSASLSEANHEIALRVQDRAGLWSAAVSAQLQVGDPPLVTIIDNRDSGVQQTGSWDISGAEGCYGADSVWSRDGATFTWNFEPLQSGEYRLSIYSTEWPSRSDSVPVTVRHADGTATVIYNQQANGGQWLELGQYLFTLASGGAVTLSAPYGSASTCADAVRFEYVHSNAPPQASIDSIVPNPALLGEAVSFSGSGSDVDGEISAYRWQSDIDGLLSELPSFATTELSEAVHLISLTVADNEGVWSAPVTRSLVVGVPENSLPIARIESIDPNPAQPGSSVHFEGSGIDYDGSVVAYRWHSDRDGLLSTLSSFTSSELSQGTHVITFQVIDDQAADSLAVSQTLVIAPPAVEFVIDNGDVETSSTGVWALSSAPQPYDGESLWSRNGATYRWLFMPQLSGYYSVQMWHTAWPSRSGAVPVSIESAEETAYLSIDQRIDGGQWNLLGQYPFEAGVAYAVTVYAEGSVASTCADALKFVKIDAPNVPVADFSVDKTLGGTPLLVQFTDKTIGIVSRWQWDFGDGHTSSEPNPIHEFAAAGAYTVTLTVSNDSGTDTEIKPNYVTVAGGTTENVYLVDAYSSGDYFMINMSNMLQEIGAVKSGNVWVYTNSQQNKTYYIHHIHSAAAMERSLKEAGSHIVFDGHSNYGLGATFGSFDEVNAQQIDTIRFLDDDLFTNYSTDMVSLKVDGMKYGQAYPNWNPVLKDGRSGIMPYTFDEGLPPYNYYLSYTITGDPETYKVELSDGRVLERFPDANTPAWFAADGSAPDPVTDRQYFITNADVEYNRADFVGDWPLAKVPNAGYMGKAGYLGYNYQYNLPGSGADKAVFTLLINHPGWYAVMASWYAAPENASNARFVIEHSNGSSVVEVDQRQTQLTNMLGSYYFERGSYTVTIADDANGRVIADAIILQYLQDPQLILQAEFSAEQQGDTVNFKDLSTIYAATDLTAAISERVWDFGDGQTSAEKDPVHRYATAGIYPVSLTIYDSNGNQDTEIKENFIVVNSPAVLQAQFTAKSRLGSERTVVQFSDQSRGAINSWAWDFGDGTTSNEQNPVHVYTAMGRAYTVTLTVSSSEALASETETDYVHNMVGINYVDNTFHTKPHFYSGDLIRFGKVIVDTGNIKIPEHELKYERFYYGGCNSANYYVGTLHRGIMIFTTADNYNESCSSLYLRNYLKGVGDYQIMYELNREEPIFEYYDFNLKPPSRR